MVILRYIGSRLLFLIPQIVGIVLVGFILIKAVPGDPATLMLGPMASTDSIAKLRTDLHLPPETSARRLRHFMADNSARAE
jgi:peptide/nickel transport system permease protein